jgi:hypothetical protein
MTNGYCTSGTYTLTPVTGTNTYLIYIVNYVRIDSTDCRTFNLSSVTNITYDVCEQNAANYAEHADPCPSADLRAFTMEKIRPDDAKCDLEPPPEVEYLNWEDGISIAFVTIASALIVFTVGVWAIIFKYRHTPVILMASPVFIHIQFFGFILGYTNIYLWTGEPTVAQCAIRPWFMTTAFVLIVGPMFAKQYRIWRIFSGKGFFAPKI